MSEVYLLVGSPACGKSWVSSQLRTRFEVIEHDDYASDKIRYIRVLEGRARVGSKPILGNTPFGVSEIMEALEKAKVQVTPIFIIEPEDILTKRYFKREKRPIPQGHLTRQSTYLKRAKELGAFVGTSEEVLNHLRGKSCSAHQQS